MLPENIRFGKVIKVFDDGFVYLEDVYPTAMGLYVGHISLAKGYKGLSPRELGIKIGTRALFRLEDGIYVKEIFFDVEKRKPRKFLFF
jgi:hypothetical protein